MSTNPLSDQNAEPIEEGSEWINVHTGAKTTVLEVGPAPMFDGQIRVLTDRDMEGGVLTNNGWSVYMFLAHWEQIR